MTKQVNLPGTLNEFGHDGTPDGMIARYWPNGDADRLVQLRGGEWTFKTLGMTLSAKFRKTREGARVQMLKDDNDSRYWHAYHAAVEAGKSATEAQAAGEAAKLPVA